MISYKRRVKLWFCGFQERYEFANRGIASRLSKFRSPAGACLSACDGYFSYICMYTGVSRSGEGSILHWSDLLMVIQPAWLLQKKKNSKRCEFKGHFTYVTITRVKNLCVCLFHKIYI